MRRKNIVIVGAGGHAKTCIDIIDSVGEYSIASIVGQDSEIGRNILGHTVTHSDKDLPFLRKKFDFAVIGLGQIYNPEPRKKVLFELEELGFLLPVIISKTAYVSKQAAIGPGTVVMNGAILNAECRIGKNVILNSASIIEHDVIIGDNCHISTSVTVNGGARIGQNSFLGSGTLVRNGIEVGEDSFVGMGSVITQSLPPGSRYKEEF